MKGDISTCTISSNYDYTKFVSELEHKYGFEQIGMGGFGIIMGVKNCVVKLIKNIKRCQELKNEIAFYERIESNWDNQLLGRVPKFSIYEEFNDYCHFNTERIYSPLLEYDDGQKTKVGYLIGDFKFLKTKYPNAKVNQEDLYYMPRRKLIHFYINHYDKNYKEKSDDRGEMYGLNILVNTFGDEYIKWLTFSMGQLLAFLIVNCQIYPFDIEVVVGCSTDKQSRIYMLDFNECLFIDNKMNIDVIAKEAARSMISKDGKHYFPNKNNIYYDDFKNGMISNRDEEETEFILNILIYYK